MAGTSMVDVGLDPTSPGVQHGFTAVFVIFAVINAAGFVFVIVAAVRNASVMRRNGLDPLTMQSHLAVQLSQHLASSNSALEQRFVELDELKAKGKITDAEHAAARVRVLSGPSD